MFWGRHNLANLIVRKLNSHDAKAGFVGSESPHATGQASVMKIKKPSVARRRATGSIASSDGQALLSLKRPLSANRCAVGEFFAHVVNSDCTKGQPILRKEEAGFLSRKYSTLVLSDSIV